MENSFEQINTDPVHEEINSDELTQLIIDQTKNIEITAEDRNKEGRLLVFPNGPQSELTNELHWKMVRTPAFKEWFGDWQNDNENSSKVIDTNGEPLLVYHASKTAFEEFDTKKSSYFLTLGKGAYFTPDPLMAARYGDIAYSCFLNTRNLINISNSGIDLIILSKNLYFSLTRPKDSALYNYNSSDKNNTKSNINQFSVLHKENIMIVPNDINNPLQ